VATAGANRFGRASVQRHWLDVVQPRACGAGSGSIVTGIRDRGAVAGQGVITIAYGDPPTLIGGPAVLVAVAIGVIAPEAEQTT
jgi:hypothetical protein